MTLDKLRLFYELTFRFIDKKQLDSAFRRYGYDRDSITPESVLMLSVVNKDFARDYANLFLEAQKGREWRTAEATGVLNYAGGGSALEWISTVANSISNLGSSAKGILEELDIHGIARKNARANELLAEAAAANANKGKTALMFVGIGLVVVVLIGLAIMVAKR